MTLKKGDWKTFSLAKLAISKIVMNFELFCLIFAQKVSKDLKNFNRLYKAA